MRSKAIGFDVSENMADQIHRHKYAWIKKRQARHPVPQTRSDLEHHAGHTAPGHDGHSVQGSSSASDNLAHTKPE